MTVFSSKPLREHNEVWSKPSGAYCAVPVTKFFLILAVLIKLSFKRDSLMLLIKGLNFTEQFFA